MRIDGVFMDVVVSYIIQELGDSWTVNGTVNFDPGTSEKQL